MGLRATCSGVRWNADRVFTPIVRGFDSRPEYVGIRGNTPKYRRGSRVYSKTYGSNATVVAVDNDNAVPIYVIRIDGSTKDSYNVYERQLDNPK